MKLISINKVREKENWSPVHIRGVNQVLYRQFRVEALKRGLTAGQLMNSVLMDWLEKESISKAPGKNACG